LGVAYNPEPLLASPLIKGEDGWGSLINPKDDFDKQSMRGVCKSLKNLGSRIFLNYF
jgi:hypothetical protein